MQRQDSDNQPIQPVPVFVDIEASGFGSQSYPIEIGVALSDTERYCALIAPDPEWHHWSQEAESLHGISRELLHSHGKPAEEVAIDLNHLLGGKTVYSDCWVLDYPWTRTLFQSAREEMKFRMSALEWLMTEVELGYWDSAKATVLQRKGGGRHRASLDANNVRATYVQAKLMAERANDAQPEGAQAPAAPK